MPAPNLIGSPLCSHTGVACQAVAVLEAGICLGPVPLGDFNRSFLNTTWFWALHLSCATPSQPAMPLIKILHLPQLCWLPGVSGLMWVTPACHPQKMRPLVYKIPVWMGAHSSIQAEHTISQALKSEFCLTVSLFCPKSYKTVKPDVTRPCPVPPAPCPTLSRTGWGFVWMAF